MAKNNFKDLVDLRTDVLEILKRSRGPVQLFDIAKQLRIRSESFEYEYLRDLLTSMSEEGIISRHSRRRYSVSSKDVKGLKGKLTLYHGSGTVHTNDIDIPIVHVRLQHLHTALDGDLVTVTPHALSDGKKVRGEVVAVVERSEHPIGGTIEYDGSFYYVIPDEAKYYVDFLVAEKNLGGAKPGDKVAATFLRWEHENASPEARVVEVLGESGRASVEFDAIRKEFALPATFSKQVEIEASRFKPPSKNVSASRLDITKELVITIDPDDAKDFDDALSLKKLKNGSMELGVHIADVSTYVKENTDLDKEALHRGNSTYLVDGVTPMLPEHLSNNICSLVPNELRNAFSVFITFSKDGKPISTRITETLIKSKRRYTYDEVQQVIEGAPDKNKKLLMDLHSLAKTLYQNRMKGGGVDFDTRELKFVLDENRMPVDAVVKTRTDATSLVEECMLAANQAVASYVQTLKQQWKVKQAPPLVYRIHEEPDSEKIAAAVGVVRALGINVASGKLTPVQINNILNSVKNKPEKSVINTLFLRAMSKAVYAETNVGHYGLGFSEYVHFTSPIRRYPDLYVHRVLKEYLAGKPTPARLRKLNLIAADVSDHTSQTERHSVEAERASQKLAQVILAREHVGEPHVGYVTGVTSFGVFVTLHNLPIEGLLHIRDLGDDYYHFDERTYRLIGRRTRRILQFGSELSVRIVRANVEKRTIDLQEIAEEVKTATTRGGSKSDESKKRGKTAKPPQKKAKTKAKKKTTASKATTKRKKSNSKKR